MGLKQTAQDIVKSGNIRVWISEGGAEPGNIPSYKGLMKFSDPSWSFGDVEKIEGPDPDAYDSFVTLSEVVGTEEFPSFGIMGRYEIAKSALLDLARRKCQFDAMALIGTCRNPQDFNRGWDKIVHFYRSRITEYSIENFGAIGSDERAGSNESGTMSAYEFYERVRLVWSQVASSTVTRPITSLDVLDMRACGDCDIVSDGNSIVFAVMNPSGATPGTSPTVLFTQNKFVTTSTTTISSLLGNEAPIDSEIVGDYFVVISNVDNSLHYASWEDILSASETWTQVTTGFVAAKAPNAIVSVGPKHTWIVGNGGYVYFSSDPAAGVSVLDAGELTTENLNDVDAFGTNHVVAVGQNNALLVSYDGSKFALVVGPSATDNLTAVAIKRKNYWIVGNDDGEVWYTKNGGTTWTQTTGFPITLTNIRDIQFVTAANGFMAADITGTHSRVLATNDGGNSWYVMPEGTGTIPANDIIYQISAGVDPNYVYCGGMADDGTDGILLRLSPG